MLLEHQDVISKFGSSSQWGKLSKEMGSDILSSGDGSHGQSFLRETRASAQVIQDNVRQRRMEKIDVEVLSDVRRVIYVTKILPFHGPPP
ncbi:hypothetical protein Tco_0240971 [Tanacetum coccineum]